MPQWQGGDEPAYSFGSELLRWLAPPHDGPEETVAVPEPDGSSPPVSRGIKWCAALLSPARAASTRTCSSSPAHTACSARRKPSRRVAPTHPPPPWTSSRRQRTARP